MKNLRTYGSPPFKIAVLHGGPGAPGYMAPVAKELSESSGVLEPLQTKDTINGQVEELYTILNEHTQLPVVLIGHSWGGFLSIIFTSGYPELVSKLILISSGPFEEKYVSSIKQTRNSRLSETEKEEAKKIEIELNEPTASDKTELLVKLGNLTSRADSYDPIPANSEVIEYQTEIHNKVWNEAVIMRKEGKFIEMIKNLTCPVSAIHGDYDPHPYEGVREPFSSYVKDFEFILLKKCGHYPWLEKHAKDDFYEVLKKTLAKV